MKLSKASAVVMTVAAVSAVFGVLREVVIAAEFGTTIETDAYFFSFDLIVRLPEFLAPAIAGALIPVFMRSRAAGEDDRFALSVVNAYMLGLVVLGVLVFVAASPIVAVLGSGFPNQERPLIVGIIRLLSPAMTFLGVAGVLRALLQADNKFFVSQISNVWISIGIVIGAIWVVPHLGVNGLPAGALGGAAFQVMWTWFWLKRSGFKYRLILDVRDERFRRFLKLLGPALIGAWLSWLVPVIDKFYATYLEAGAIATLNFGSRPVALLARIFINSIVVAALPVYTAKALLDNPTEYRASVQRTLATLSFILLPTSLILGALRVPIIEILFQRGAFDAASVTQTAGVFAARILALAPAGIGVVVSTAFNSVEDTKTPAIYGAGTNVVVKLFVVPMLMIPLGVAGIALSMAVMYTVSGYLLLVLFERRVFILGRRSLLVSLARSLIASVIAAASVETMTRLMDTPALVTLVLGLTLGLAVYLALSALMRSPELAMVVERYPKMRVRLK